MDRRWVEEGYVEGWRDQLAPPLNANVSFPPQKYPLWQSLGRSLERPRNMTFYEKVNQDKGRREGTEADTYFMLHHPFCHKKELRF